jgi:hypothetical protein
VPTGDGTPSNVKPVRWLLNHVGAECLASISRIRSRGQEPRGRGCILSRWPCRMGLPSPSAPQCLPSHSSFKMKFHWDSSPSCASATVAYMPAAVQLAATPSLRWGPRFAWVQLPTSLHRCLYEESRTFCTMHSVLVLEGSVCSMCAGVHCMATSWTYATTAYLHRLHWHRCSQLVCQVRTRNNLCM